ncbi:hypothetical protein CDAR_79711 [Caerostris darwini]|uniref:Uncharacterized protein n=1 Tax=Caerostris darwini TaxID=1538125 RepID=A0AAV4V936_9ARAC|nr:hypothetical protein CDAR_79711 [Caerostris darwini]
MPSKFSRLENIRDFSEGILFLGLDSCVLGELASFNFESNCERINCSFTYLFPILSMGISAAKIPRIKVLKPIGGFLAVCNSATVRKSWIKLLDKCNSLKQRRGVCIYNMSFMRYKNYGTGRKRSHSLPTPINIIKNNAKFFSRRNSPDSGSNSSLESINF